MGAGPITFVYSNWEALFPALSGVNSAQATMYFGLATMYVRNDGGGSINDPVKLTNALYLTTAHIAVLFAQQTNGSPTTGGTEPPSPLVGRIASATEGSVSVAAEMPEQPPSAAWWNQTTYGAAAWKMLAPNRTARIVPAPRRIYNPPVGPYFGRGW